MASAVETAIRAVVTKGLVSVAAFNRQHRKTRSPNPFLEGIHKPMSEELTLTDLQVRGEIPAGLNGRYVRIGPNPAAAQNPATYHWFSGDGMVHGIRLQGGKALWYRNRWIRSTAVSRFLGEAPAPGPRGSFDTVNTNVLGHAGSTWALVEAGGYPVRIDEELNTIAHDPFGGTLDGAYTAHPHTDPDTGELHAICYEGNALNTVWHVVVDTNGKVRRREPIEVAHGPSIHDCMITKNYVIILDLPVTFSFKRLLGGQQFPYAWNPKHKARVGLLPREGKGSETIWCDVEPCYVFHPSNAYETEHGKVILDVCAHQTMFAESDMGPDSKTVPFERWTVDPHARRVQRVVLDQADQEFPRPDERFIGKPYRYAFTVALPRGGDEAFLNETRLFKHDLETGARQVHDFGEGRVPGEFVFVPRNAQAAEGDGWLIGYVIDKTDETTDFVILDAQRFEGAPQAVVKLPHRIPPGFHGNWIAD
jgi:carotenoid cleavage dioxygenase